MKESSTVAMRSVVLFFTCIQVISMTLGLSSDPRISQHFDYETYTAKRLRQLAHQILPTGNILQLATSLGETELVTYLNKTGLATSVSEITPLTLFGPSNAALAAVSPAVRTQLDHNPAAAFAIFSYHIADDEVLSSDFVNEQLLKTKLGLDIRINVYPLTNATTASGRPIQVVDNVATNGVLHELSALMLPPGGTISQVLAEVPDLSILLSAIKAAGMSDMLSAFEPYTLFAPTNQAFQALPAGEWSQLLRNTTRLQEVLGYHVARGTTYSAGIGPQMTIPVLSGSLAVVKEGSMVTVNNTARVTFSDLSATNGVVHLIDSVLFLTG
ncbi:transforming growth factor-beta-induced protein ig-h3-like [Pomacea canaliculata]|uniref:transforming growth factor-beta-induced protein ig-h3-like n=1 Tax=Pomacea canaliculata TaxID=400727 RepID=UPI000D73D13E|nr:transforming growth factor-beta-induced protein ig-h3-like [Pomacea canaliculata]